MMRKRKGHPVYPLTAAQKFHFFYQNFCPKKEVLNVGTSLTIDNALDWNVLKGAIYKAYERCECLRVRFAHEPHCHDQDAGRLPRSLSAGRSPYYGCAVADLFPEGCDRDLL